MAENLPKDPVILLSYINTQLRDHYGSLQELCKAYNIEEQEIVEPLSEIDYAYDTAVNQFV